MARLLKQSTAFTFRAGPFLDSTDGVTAETGLTIAQADIQISKDGGAFAQTSASPTTTHDADGWYQCPLTATDTNTLGPLTVQIAVSGALPVWHDFMVVPAIVYDSLVDGSDILTVDTTQINGVAAAAQLLEDQLSAVETGTAQAGAAGSITLASGESATNDIYNGQFVWILSGTGAGQVRQITDYVGSTKVASVEPNWATNPSTDSVYVLIPVAAAPDSTLPDVNVTQVAGQTASAASAVDFDDIAAILTDTGTTLPATLSTIDSNVDAILVDTAEIGAAGAGLTEAGGTGDHLTALATAAALTTVDTVVDAIKVVTDKQGVATISGAAATGTLTTGSCTSDLSGYAADELIGRVITFDNDATGCPGFQSVIDDYTVSGGLISWSGTASAAPQDGDGFTIT